MNFNKRYGNHKLYARHCAIAHKKTKQRCVVCFGVSEQIHHAYYGDDIIGISTFPVCAVCHKRVCHSPKNWVKDKKHPVWGNRNTPKFLARLQLGFVILSKGC